jgi:ornithine cyclodeaminase/alanine dehydrogenase-like protein (mu-crystallin family)
VALLIGNEDVARVLDMDTCIDSIEEGVREYFRGDATCRPRIDVWAPCSDPAGYFQWGSMEGTSRRYAVFAMRIKSDIAYWPRHGDAPPTQEKYCKEPGTYCGLIFLFSLDNGEPLAIMHDGHLQHLRVGATAGIAAKYLAREDAATVAIIGSGGMARTHAQAFTRVRRIRRIRVFSPTVEHRHAYAREMGAALGVEVVPVSSAGEAVRGADIVASCTDAICATIPGRYLEDGAFVCTVKGSIEMDDATIDRVSAFFTFGAGEDVVVPQMEGPAARAHRISAGCRAYVAGRPDELARIPQMTPPPTIEARKLARFRDLFEGRRQGRTDAREILGIVGNHIQGIQFASVGGAALRLVRDRGLGRELPTEWLLQDVRN